MTRWRRCNGRCRGTAMAMTRPRLFARGGFSTPDGRAPDGAAAAAAREEAAAEFPLTLNTGRIRDQWHTMTRTGRVPHLMTHVAAPGLALHPRDAAARGVADRGLVRLESAQASGGDARQRG